MGSSKAWRKPASRDGFFAASPIRARAVTRTRAGNQANNRMRRGQRVVIECQAQRLDSPLDATLTLTDAGGRQLAANGDWFGRDPLLDFTAPADGDVFVNVHDLSYRGGQPYRLVITDRPRVENVEERMLSRCLLSAIRKVAINLQRQHAHGIGIGKAFQPDAIRFARLRGLGMCEAVRQHGKREE